MEPDKQFLVFTYDQYGPSDLTPSFDTVDEAKEYAKTLRCDYYDIYDRINGISL